jgi:hypothetical protein
LEYLAPFNRTFIGYTIEPFLQGIFERNPTPAAYPPDRSRTLLPLNIMFAWKPESSDDIMHWAVRESTRHLRSVAEAEGQDLSGKALYPNYAPGGTPIEAMYGQNVAKLKAIKASVDPENVMGLAGGPKFWGIFARLTTRHAYGMHSGRKGFEWRSEVGWAVDLQTP